MALCTGENVAADDVCTVGMPSKIKRCSMLLPHALLFDDITRSSERSPRAVHQPHGRLTADHSRSDRHPKEINGVRGKLFRLFSGDRTARTRVAILMRDEMTVCCAMRRALPPKLRFHA